MKSKLLIFLLTLILIAACAPATPIPYRPTPTIRKTYYEPSDEDYAAMADWYEEQLNKYDHLMDEDDWSSSNRSYSSNSSAGCPNGCTYFKSGCDIKGNISINSGEKIFHVPGQEFYSDTKISPEYGERWFCTEAEARANGWRKAKK